MGQNRQYDQEYKVQAVKLAKEIGVQKAAQDLGIPYNTLYGWYQAARKGELDVGPGFRTPEDSMSLAEEVVMLRQKVKTQAKEIKELTEINEILEEASAFFAASRRKSAKKND